MLTLYSRFWSPPCIAVLMTARHLGLNLKVVELDLENREQLHNEQFLALNPQHTVPTLLDDDFILSDSHAIMTYLVETYGGTNDSLYPKKDCKTRAKIDQHLHFEGSVLYARMRYIAEAIFYLHTTIIQKDLFDYVYLGFDLLEAVLRDDGYLVGDTVTLADLSCVTTVTMLIYSLHSTMENYPKINAWIDRMKKLPYFDEINEKGAKVVGVMMSERLASLK